jgi:hypothetical protein
MIRPPPYRRGRLWLDAPSSQVPARPRGETRVISAISVVAEEKRLGEGFSDAPWKRGKPDGRVPEAQSAGHLMAEMNPTKTPN